jgi:hypothetical protein
LYVFLLLFHILLSWKKKKKEEEEKQTYAYLRNPPSPFTPNPIDPIWFHLGERKGSWIFFHHKLPKSQFDDNNVKFIFS